jgi:hypothetical protein
VIAASGCCSWRRRFAVLDVTGSARDLAYVLVAQSLPTALLIYVGGVWGDRLPRRGLSSSPIPSGWAAGARSPRCCSPGRPTSGSSSSWLLCGEWRTRSLDRRTSGSSRKTVDASQLRQANGLLQLSTNLCGVLGPAAAGAIVATTNPGWALAVDAATFIPSTVLLLAIGPLGSVRRPPSRVRDDFADGLREVRDRPWLLGAIFSGAVYTFAALPAMSVLGPVVAKQSLGGAAAWSVIVAAWGAGTAVGSLVSLRVRPARPLATCFRLALICGGPTLLLLAAAAPTAVIAAAELLNGAVSGLFFSLEATLLQQHIPGRALSRVTALHQGTWTVVAPLGVAFTGVLAATIGTTDALILAAAAAFASNALPLMLADVRRLEWGDQPVPAEAPAT